MPKDLPMKLNKIDAKIFQDFVTGGRHSYFAKPRISNQNYPKRHQRRCLSMAGLERSRYSYQEKEYKRGRSFFDLRCGFRRKSWRSVPCILACETEFLLAGALKK